MAENETVEVKAKLTADTHELDELIEKLKEANSLADELTSKFQKLKRNIIVDITATEPADVFTDGNGD